MTALAFHILYITTGYFYSINVTFYGILIKLGKPQVFAQLVLDFLIGDGARIVTARIPAVFNLISAAPYYLTIFSCYPSVIASTFAAN